ncbi:4274_t:CDS:2 [Gigaspora margarita]|uniref:4274_t:CDS:1 n=1 Tax=Gigaspora margarita TaxID=4874 RepID=A0ABN7V0X7_GIGMA|nr:4274_t:CDS:2 [Gigaspora margarita]
METVLIDDQYNNEYQAKKSCNAQLTTIKFLNPSLPVPFATLVSKSGNISIPLSILDIMSSVPVEFKQNSFEEIEIDQNLEIYLAISTIESDELSKIAKQ